MTVYIRVQTVLPNGLFRIMKCSISGGKPRFGKLRKIAGAEGQEQQGGLPLLMKM